MSGDWLMGAGQGADYEWWLANDHLVDSLDHRQALAAAIETGSADCPFIAEHRKQPAEQLWDKHLTAQWMTEDEREF